MTGIPPIDRERHAARFIATAVFCLVPLSACLQRAGHLAGIRDAFLAELVLLPAAALALLLVRPQPLCPSPLFENRRQRLVFVLLLALGAVARLAAWKTFPPADGQLWEEAQTISVALGSLGEASLDLSFPLTDLTTELGLLTFGISLPAVRIVFALLGVASVGAFFVASRLLLGSFFAAVFATALFASNPMLAGSSRVALETMSPIFTLCLALAALFYARARRDLPSAALAGVASGFLLLEYDAYRIVPVWSALFLLLTGALEPQSRKTPAGRSNSLPFLRRFAPAVVFVLFAGLVLLPFFAPDPHGATERLSEGYRRHHAGLQVQREGLGVGRSLVDDLGKVAMMVERLAWHGHSNDILPGSMGVFDPLTGLLGAAGLLQCAFSVRRRPEGLFLAGGVALITVLSGVLVQNPARYRLLPAIPFVLLSIGVLVDELIERGRGRLLPPRALSVLLVLLVALNAHRFFGVAIRDPHVQEDFYSLDLLLAYEIRAIQASDPAATVHLVSDLDHLGRPNDFAAFYDPARVRVHAPASRIPDDASAHLLSHDPFVGAARALPGLTDCRRWKTKFDRNQILHCRFAPPAAETRPCAGP